MGLSRRDILRKLTWSAGAMIMNFVVRPIAASPMEDALFRQIAERSKTDPLVGAKIGSKEITHRLLSAMKGENGVHIESVLCALGSLAGYSCQASVRAQATAQGLEETTNLVTVITKNGRHFFFGDHLNKPLAESVYSVWNLAGGAAQQGGCQTLPDVMEIFEHVTNSIETDAFGQPRMTKEHLPQDTPINYVQTLWPEFLPMIRKFCPDPEHWPILLGLSVQQMIIMGKDILDPCQALKLVMESAIPMSKVDITAS